jgi:hypothetical protein
MFKQTAKKSLDYLENNQLTQEEHLRLLGILNKQINAFPLETVVFINNQGATCANGRELTLEETVKFRQGISALRDNWSFQLLADQILFEAIKIGIHEGHTTERLMFSKSVIYFLTKFKELIVKFDINN